MAIKALSDHLDSILIGLLLSAQLHLLIPDNLLRRGGRWVLANFRLTTVLGLNQHSHVSLRIRKLFLRGGHHVNVIDSIELVTVNRISVIIGLFQSNLLRLLFFIAFLFLNYRQLLLLKNISING
jgi:hypothetical protein